jgi:3-(3-hydroxy-phenyl)propionate hydroxylase
MAHATSMVRLSMRMGSIIKMENLVAVAVRDFIGGVINRIPRARDYFGEMRFRPLPRYERGVVVDQSTLEPGHASLKVTSTLIPFLQAVDKTSPVGTQFPQPMVRTSQGAMLLDQAIGHWWSLLTWMNDPTALLGVEGLADARRLGARLAVIVPEVQRVWTEQHMPGAVVVIGDETGELKKWLDTRAIGALLLRPDRFIAGACLAQEAPALLAAALSAMSATASTMSSTNEGEL